MRSAGLVVAIVALSVALASCDASPPVRRIAATAVVERPDVQPTLPPANGTDAGFVMARCPRRALAPDELSRGALIRGSASVAWSGHEWGVVWAEAVEGEPAVFFAREGEDGRRHGAPSRISEHAYRGLAPAIAWNGENWLVAYQGGASRWDEVWLASVDARGTTMGRPHRLTARERRDRAPALGINGSDVALVWSATMPDSRDGVFALRLNRWGAQLGIPVRLADRAEHLGSPRVVWNGAGWTSAWLVARNEAIGVDMTRVQPLVDAPRGYPARVTSGPLGGSDLAARFGVAWDGERYALVWDEVRDGGPHVFFDTITARLDSSARSTMLSRAVDAATSPAIVALAPGVFVVAWAVERGIEQHAHVQAFDGDGHALAERIEVQANDGQAGDPTLAIGRGAIGLATVSNHGIAFHRVELGGCAGATVSTDR